MNYELEVSKSRPAVFNSLNGGYPPLVSGSGSATKQTTNLDTTFPAFNQGYEDTPFTLEVWFLPLTNTGEQIVIGHAGEGAIWNGTSFILRFKHGDGSVVTEQSYTPPNIKAFYITVVYTIGHALLYVDGEVVIALELPQSLFFAVAQPIKINNGTGTAIYDSLALYYRALSQSEIKQHYSWGNDVRDASAIAMLRRGATWTLSYEDVPVAERFVFDTSNFADGYTDNIMVTNNLVTSIDAVGTWRQSIALSSLVGATSPGVHMTYEGQGVTMSYSLDGTTWTSVANKTTILQDQALTDAMLFVQLELANDDAWASQLKVDVLSSREMRPASGNRMLTFKSAAMDQTPGNQLDYQRDWGADFKSNGEIIILPDGGDTPATVGSTEMWVKFNGLSGTAFDGQVGTTGMGWLALSSGALAFGGGTVYVNGIQRTTFTFEVGVWYHIVFVETTPSNMTTYIGRARAGGSNISVTVGHIASYPQQFNASQVTTLYNLNVGAPALRVDDTSGITLTEQAPAVAIYAYSWSYVSSGR